MPYRDKKLEKLYYSIGEVAELFEVAPSLIRFWESEFDTINPRKNRKGIRQFTKEDIEAIKVVYQLVKEKGYTLQGAKEYIKLKKHDSIKDKAELIESLEKIKSFLIELKKGLP